MVGGILNLFQTFLFCNMLTVYLQTHCWKLTYYQKKFFSKVEILSHQMQLQCNSSCIFLVIPWLDDDQLIQRKLVAGHSAIKCWYKFYWIAHSFLILSTNYALFQKDNQGAYVCIYVGQYMLIPLFKKCTFSLPVLFYIEDLKFSVISIIIFKIFM